MKKLVWIVTGVFFFALILLLPCCSGLSGEGKVVLATTVLMATWWLTDAIPMGATALVPLFIFPLFGVMSAKQVSPPYADRHIFLFLGGLIIAEAIQKWNLHKRIAVTIVSFLGSNPKTIILGFMVATAFLSMWMSNTATTLMMMPIGMAILASFGEKLEESEDLINFSKTLMLSIAYAATIGGIATLVGTPPNLVLAGVYQKLFNQQITFSQWMAIGFPISVFMLFFAWIYMVNFGFPFKNLPRKKIGNVISEEKASLGPMSYEEKVVLIVFFLVALGWITRSDIHIGSVTLKGWSNLFPHKKFISDSTVAMFFAILLFLIPSRNERGEMLLNWKDMKNIPWEVLFLFGGGFALAKGFEVSKLTVWIGQQLSFITHLHPLLLILVVVITLEIVTEFTSNTATTTIMLPILAGIAQTGHINPMYLLVPATLGASSAFMLPVATPPNAIVMGSGVLEIKDMAKAGIWLDIFAAIVITLYIYLLF